MKYFKLYTFKDNRKYLGQNTGNSIHIKSGMGFAKTVFVVAHEIAHNYISHHYPKYQQEALADLCAAKYMNKNFKYQYSKCKDILFKKEIREFMLKVKTGNKRFNRIYNKFIDNKYTIKQMSLKICKGDL